MHALLFSTLSCGVSTANQQRIKLLYDWLELPPLAPLFDNTTPGPFSGWRLRSFTFGLKPLTRDIADLESNMAYLFQHPLRFLFSDYAACLPSPRALFLM